MTSSIRTNKLAETIGYWLLAIGSLFAEPALAFTPNDPFYVNQWYLDKINAPTAWDMTTGSGEVVVAVLDTGVDLDHPDIAANLWMNTREVLDGIDNDGNGYIDDTRGWNFVENNNNPQPATTGATSPAGLVHGTLISGLIAAIGNNHEGVAGVTWRTKIMPVRVLDSAGNGKYPNVVRGIDYAVQNGAHIVNLSFTTFDNFLAVNDAVRRAKDAGVLIVASAGNDESLNLDRKSVYPVCTDGPAGENWVLGVAATGRRDEKSSFSNYGSLCVDISAPGEEIFGAQFVDSTISGSTSYGGYWSGTSLAAPLVAGAAALVRAVAPNISRTDVIDILKRTALPIDSLNTSYRGGLGRGRLDLAAAVSRALERGRTSARGRIVAAGDGGVTPRVFIFDAQGALVHTFLAYAQSFTGGVRLAAGDLDGDGTPEIVTGAGPGGGPHVRIFDKNGTVKAQFFAFDTTYRGGVRLTAADLDGDRKAEIIVVRGAADQSEVRIFASNGTLKGSFAAFVPARRVTMGVGSLDRDSDGRAELLVGAGGTDASLRGFSPQGALLIAFPLPAELTSGLRLVTF